MTLLHEQNRIYALNEDKKLIAEITFPEIDTNTVCITHTFVDPSLRGQGVANQLMTEAVKQLQEEHRTITASCSYALEWMKKHSL